ncbi:PRC and DUF2382 domain-containing protein [Luteococcus sediminum]
MTDNTANNNFDYDRYYGTVIDSEGNKVGDVGQVYLDDATGRPEWVTVRTGLFGMKETFVPLQGENVSNGEIHVPYTKDQIKGAPSIDPEGHITEAEEAELYRYYSIKQDLGAYEGRDAVATDRVATDRVATDRVDTDRDANLEGDIIRHEERLNVGKEEVETGRVHIRKHVVNEQQSVQVPVEREELRVERTPIADGEVVRGGRLEEGETEVVLHEERPVVSKETVGVEKVSVGKETVVENETVTANVAKEQIEVDRDVNEVRDDRSVADKVKDKLDRDNDGKIG